MAESFCRDGAQVFPDKSRCRLLPSVREFSGKEDHGAAARLRNGSCFVVKSGTFATDRFGNQKAAVFRMFGVEGGRVDLHVIRVLQFDVMPAGNGKASPVRWRKLVECL